VVGETRWRGDITALSWELSPRAIVLPGDRSPEFEESKSISRAAYASGACVIKAQYIVRRLT
jgi:hypothetical protein